MSSDIIHIKSLLEPGIREKMCLEAKPGQRYARAVMADDRYVLYRLIQHFIEPIYGMRENMVDDWISGRKGKQTFLFFQDDFVVGLLSFKANPEKSYAKISTLFVLPRFRGCGNGSFLLMAAENLAKVYGKDELLVTVSQEREAAREFFLTKGFEEIAQAEDRYKEGVVEYILKKRLV